jgi:hypothetical protein
MGESTDDRAEIAAMNARLGAMLAGKGLAPDQVATLVRDHVQPLMDDLLVRAERGEDISTLGFVIQPVDQEQPAE